MMSREAWQSLTSSQKAVAYRVGEGKTHEEISRECGISTKTVNNHLSAVYAKLEISGPIKKTILAVWMWRSGLMN
jgi:DNA-binding CsgD family transcriptional regulator